MAVNLILPQTYLYNNTIEEGKGAHSPNSTTQDIALIIQNVPYTDINNIQSLILYNRTEGGSFFGLRAVGLAIELYNSISDPNLNKVLSNTNVITTHSTTYRFNFPSISTYNGGFSATDSTSKMLMIFML